jgi:hypothetical protein
VAGEIGGLAGYQIGLKWGRQLVERPGKHQAYRERMLSNGERAYARWGRLAVFFTPALVSGTAKMPHRQFAVWNLVDSLGFALFTIGGAYGIGKVVTGHHAARHRHSRPLPGTRGADAPDRSATSSGLHRETALRRSVPCAVGRSQPRSGLPPQSGVPTLVIMRSSVERRWSRERHGGSWVGRVHRTPLS